MLAITPAHLFLIAAAHNSRHRESMSDASSADRGPLTRPAWPPAASPAAAVATSDALAVVPADRESAGLLPDSLMTRGSTDSHSGVGGGMSGRSLMATQMTRAVEDSYTSNRD